jgi:hypothetical protein
LKQKQKGRCLQPVSFFQAGLAFALLLNAAAPAVAEEGVKPAAAKPMTIMPGTTGPDTTANWRPKDGIYAAPGKDFVHQCGEFGEVVLKLTQKSFVVDEVACTITKLTDTAPGAIRLDMTCSDVNLAAALNEPTEREFKEIMLLKKVDDKTLFARKTENGKFTVPGWQISYCPEKAQRSYEAMERRDRESKMKSEAAAKAAKPAAQ